MATADLIVSDIHLGAVPDSTERAFVRFLDTTAAGCSNLLIAGDLFDFWFEYGEVIPGRHFRTLAAIARLVEDGTNVVMAGGNHDAWGGRFLREHVGMTYHVEPFRMQLGGRTALVAHGDGLGKGDLKYRTLKAALRSRVAVGAFRALHPELGLRVARAVSTTEAKSGEDLHASGRAAFLESWAEEQLREDATLQLVVCGHSHIPVVREVERGRFYVNSGAWIQQFTYVEVGAFGPELRVFRDGESVGVGDRER